MPNHHYPPYYRSEAGYRALMDWYDRAWSRLRVPAERLCLPTRCGMTHVVAAGREDAPPLLLLHGINTCAAAWIPQIDGLAGAFRVYAPDVPGFAGRSASTRLRYDDDSFAAWGVDLLDALGVEQVGLIGGSAGGYFALRLASGAPERVSRLALINPCGIVPYRFPYGLVRLPGVVHLLNMLASRVFASPRVAGWLVGKGVAPGLTPDALWVEFSYLILKHYRRYGAPGPLRADDLRRVTMPVLLLFGQYEVFTAPERAIRRARALMPHVQAEILPDAGHDANRDQAEVVNARLRAFLAELNRPAVTIVPTQESIYIQEAG